MTEPMKIGDKIFWLEPKLKPWFGYFKPYSLFKRLYCWFRGRSTDEYIPGILDNQRKVSSD